MGTDVHGGFIKYNKETGEKLAVKTNWEMGRDYTLFAILAGVRNGYGFAGCYRHEPLTPIAEGRGIPDWLEVGDECYCPELHNKWYGRYGNEQEFGEYLGDHSFTYMTVDEILAWSGWGAKLLRGGVLGKEHYLETLYISKAPEHWCGGVSGGGTVTVEENVFMDLLLMGMGEKVTHVSCKWVAEETLAESKEYFLKEVKRIKDEFGGNTYLVLGFDS